MVQGQDNFKKKGPLLLVANHPNSFLDAIIIAAHFDQPVHFLARGDAFRKPWHRTLLSLLHMVPIYRLSEGRENLHLNEYAFERSQQLLREGQIVLIFIEGICLNTHQLQPFKKGAARIALTAVKEKIALGIMPIGISYDNFSAIGKSVRIETASNIDAKTLLPFQEDVQNFQHFNQALFNELAPLVDVAKIEKKKGNIFFVLPSIIGHVLHVPLYRLIKNIVRKKTKNTVFYDSVLFGMLLILYPLYLLVILLILSFVHLPLYAVLLILVIHPITAWFAVRYKIKP